MNRNIALLCSLASMVLALAGTPAHAALGGGIVIPYAGKLELDGVLVTGTVDFEFGVAPNGTDDPPTESFDSPGCIFPVPNVPVTNGEFAVSIPIPVRQESCVRGNDVHLVVSVARSGETLVFLGKQRVTPVVAAATSGSGNFEVGDRLTAKGVRTDGIILSGNGIFATNGTEEAANIFLQPKNSPAANGARGIVEVKGTLTSSSVIVTSPDNNGATNIAEFKALNLTQGVGIGFNTVRATGENGAVDLFLEGKGTGIVRVNDDLAVAGRITSQCRAGFTAIDGGRICISTLMQPRNGNVVGSPVAMQDRVDGAIRTCRAQRAHVCTHTDIQQVCGNFLAGDGLNPYSEIGIQNFWYGDLAGNDLFQFNTNAFASCSANLDNQSAGAAEGSGGLALYRCCY